MKKYFYAIGIASCYFLNITAVQKNIIKHVKGSPHLVIIKKLKSERVVGYSCVNVNDGIIQTTDKVKGTEILYKYYNLSKLENLMGDIAEIYNMALEYTYENLSTTKKN